MDEPEHDPDNGTCVILGATNGALLKARICRYLGVEPPALVKNFGSFEALRVILAIEK